MKVLLCHPKTQHSHKVARLLQKNNILQKFVNSLVISSFVARFIPQIVRKKISGRIIDIPQRQLRVSIKSELKSIFFKKILKKYDDDAYYAINEVYQKSIPQSLIKASDVVIGYDSSSWILAKRAKEQNKVFILERTIAHHEVTRSIFAESLLKYPEWADGLTFKKSDSYIKLEDFEFKTADFVTVGSNFVKTSLINNGVDEQKIVVNPYGINTEYFKANKAPMKSTINFLFFGTLSARKGMPTLLKAWEKLAPENATLTLAGFGNLPEFVNVPANVILAGKIAADKRNELYNSAHVFVFPSLLEGFAQVLIEAAACGLPIITTHNSGGGDIVKENINGFLIKPNDEADLVSKMKFFIDNPEKIHEMGNSLLKEIREDFSLEAYEKRWMNLLALADASLNKN